MEHVYQNILNTVLKNVNLVEFKDQIKSLIIDYKKQLRKIEKNLTYVKSKPDLNNYYDKLIGEKLITENALQTIEQKFIDIGKFICISRQYKRGETNYTEEQMYKFYLNLMIGVKI